jgi:hypothetical protein
MKTKTIKTFTTKVGLDAELRLTTGGFINGYVKLPKHLEGEKTSYDDFYDIEVHGGVTYVGDLREDEGTWVGFDTAHCGDGKNFDLVREVFGEELDAEELDYISYKEELEYEFSDNNDIFRDEEYVTKECEKLAEQLQKL